MFFVRACARSVTATDDEYVNFHFAFRYLVETHFERKKASAVQNDVDRSNHLATLCGKIVVKAECSATVVIFDFASLVMITWSTFWDLKLRNNLVILILENFTP